VVGLDGYTTIPDRTTAARIGYVIREFTINIRLTSGRYQMLDAFSGLFYTLFTTLAILFGLKAIRSIFKGKWMAPVFRDNNKSGRLKLKATLQHTWTKIS
jgi:hypothetical protein